MLTVRCILRFYTFENSSGYWATPLTLNNIPLTNSFAINYSFGTLYVVLIFHSVAGLKPNFGQYSLCLNTITDLIPYSFALVSPSFIKIPLIPQFWYSGRTEMVAYAKLSNPSFDDLIILTRENIVCPTIIESFWCYNGKLRLKSFTHSYFI